MKMTPKTVGLVSVFVALVVIGPNSTAAEEIPPPLILAPGDGVSGDRYGYNVAISGNTLAACAPSHMHDLTQGALYIYGRTLDGWEFVEELEPEGIPAYSGFCNSGGSLSIDGPHIAVGASQEQVVLVFRRIDGQWQFSQKISNPHGTAHSDHFGAAVALKGIWMAVGLPFRDNGEIAFYRFNGEVWAHTQIWEAESWDGSRVGDVLSMTEDVLVAGKFDAPPSMDGYIGILTRSESVWSFWGSKSIADANGLGFAVGISQNRTIAASSLEEHDGYGLGSVYVWEFIDDDWVLSANLHPQNFVYWENFGRKLAISDGTLLVGKYQDDFWAEDAGAVHVYERGDRGWNLEVILDPPDPQAHAMYSYGVAASNLSWVMAAPIWSRSSRWGGFCLRHHSVRPPSRRFRNRRYLGVVVGGALMCC